MSEPSLINLVSVSDDATISLKFCFKFPCPYYIDFTVREDADTSVEIGRVVATDADNLEPIIYGGGDRIFAVHLLTGMIQKRLPDVELDFETT